LKLDFQPLFRHPHLLTVAGNFWRRSIDLSRFPALRKLYRIDSQTAIVAFEHQPDAPHAQIVFAHGLEGSADAGYIASFSQAP